MEQFSNNASTTLNGAILASDTSLTVTSATGFPSTGNFRLLVESEIMLVTAVAGTSFTVTRGIEGTTAVGHANGVSVFQSLTSGAVAQLKLDVSAATMALETVGGRLSLTPGTPVTTANVTGATTIYFTPYKSGRIALYTNSLWQMYNLSELSLALGTLANNSNYDVFVYDSGGGVGVLEFSAAWTSDTVRSQALAQQDGVWVKSADHTRRYVGTFRTTSTTTTEDSVAKRFVWNQYNQEPRKLLRQETASSWTYNAQTWRQANTNTANKVEVVLGQAWSYLNVRADVHCQSASSGAGAGVGIGIDSTTVNSADTYGGAPGTGFWVQESASYKGYPGLGYHAANWLEWSSGGVVSTFYGTNGNATLFQGGMNGEVLA